MEKKLSQLDRIEQYCLLSGKNVLTFEDVKVLTGLSGSYLYKLTASNSIPFYRPNGKMLYFERKEIENWCLRNRVKTSAEIEQEATNYIVTGKRKGVTI